MEREILRELKKAGEASEVILERKLFEATSTLKLDAVQAAVAEALIRWAIAQPGVQEDASKPDAIVNWVEMGGRALDIISPATAEAKTASLDGVEAAAAITLIDWAIKQPEVTSQAQAGLMDYVGIGGAIITSNKALQATPEEKAALEAEKKAKMTGPGPDAGKPPAALPKPEEMPPEEPEEEEEAPEEMGPEMESKLHAKCKMLAEKIVVLEYLKGKKELTEKEKAFVTEVENSEITESEFTLVKAMFEASKKARGLKGALKLKKAPKVKGAIKLKDSLSEAIWEFGDYTIQELFKIRDAAKILEDLGIQQDEDMMMELRAEIDKRAEENPA